MRQRRGGREASDRDIPATDFADRVDPSLADARMRFTMGEIDETKLRAVLLALREGDNG